MTKKLGNLPDEDHIIRHVSWTKLRRDEDDTVLGFLPQAFVRRDTEDYLSVGWVEYGTSPEAKIRDAVWAVRKALTIGGKSAFGVANVGKVKQICQGLGAPVRIVHEPTEKWPAHSGIRRLPRDDLGLLEALAVEAFSEMILNQDVPPQPNG